MFNFVKNGQNDANTTHLTNCKAKAYFCLHLAFRKPAENRTKLLNACRGQKERHF